MSWNCVVLSLGLGALKNYLDLRALWTKAAWDPLVQATPWLDGPPLWAAAEPWIVPISPFFLYVCSPASDASTLLGFSFNMSSFSDSPGNSFECFPKSLPWAYFLSLDTLSGWPCPLLPPFSQSVLFTSDSKIEVANSNNFRARQCICGIEEMVYHWFPKQTIVILVIFSVHWVFNRESFFSFLKNFILMW